MAGETSVTELAAGARCWFPSALLILQYSRHGGRPGRWGADDEVISSRSHRTTTEGVALVTG